MPPSKDGGSTIGPSIHVKKVITNDLLKVNILQNVFVPHLDENENPISP